MKTETFDNAAAERRHVALRLANGDMLHGEVTIHWDGLNRVMFDRAAKNARGVSTLMAGAIVLRIKKGAPK